MLLGRKTIVLNKFSTKFDFYKNTPEFIEVNSEETKESLIKKINCAAQRASLYEGIFEEAKSLNDNFFSQVKQIILSNNISKRGNYQALYELNCNQSWNRLDKANRALLEISKLKTENNELKANLLDLQNKFNKLDQKVRKKSLSYKIRNLLK